ncbi:M23 family metallopeptidase [Brevibacillus dissolubilis]|uniref:M23 family metallopeptidase n=1 Tax=Brevibacillus dissolubilis TaxID=1844116 RepID=UPI0021000D9E|nr:M23 family metallopeptidase [Brevibacillus dissolubilis]
MRFFYLLWQKLKTGCLIAGIPLLLLLGTVFMTFTVVFILPMTYFEKEGVLAFFTTGDSEWDLEKDKELAERYQRLSVENLGSQEEQMYTPSQHDQAYPYRVPWALLAAIDRVLADPMILSNKDVRKLRNPAPEKHYAAVKPYYYWRDSTVLVKRTTVGSDGKRVTVTETYTVKLLDQVETYKAVYRLRYRQSTTQHGDVTVHQEKLDSVEIDFLPDEQNRLYELLITYGLPKQDRQLIQELAITYSDETEREEMEELLRHYGNASDSVPIPPHPDLPPTQWKGSLPLAGKMGRDFKLTSHFGYRNDPFTGKTAYHDGVDLAAPTGTPVYAPLDGVVAFAGTMRGYGNTILLRHGGVLTLYGHLHVIGVVKGQAVKKGETIGQVGSTGRSTGPHLHWGAYRSAFGKQNAFDPMSLLNNGGD